MLRYTWAEAAASGRERGADGARAARGARAGRRRTRTLPPPRTRVALHPASHTNKYLTLLSLIDDSELNQARDGGMTGIRSYRIVLSWHLRGANWETFAQLWDIRIIVIYHFFSFFIRSFLETGQINKNNVFP